MIPVQVYIHLLVHTSLILREMNHGEDFSDRDFVPFYLIGLALKHFLVSIILFQGNEEERQCNFVPHGIF